jgi:hypothetical protein
LEIPHFCPPLSCRVGDGRRAPNLGQVTGLGLILPKTQTYYSISTLPSCATGTIIAFLSLLHHSSSCPRLLTYSTKIRHGGTHAKSTYLPILLKTLSKSMHSWPLFRSSITSRALRRTTGQR